MFKYTDMVMALTPLGVFGAMAYNVSSMAAGHTVNGVQLEGWRAVFHLLKQYSLLVGSLYFALLILFALVFVPVAWIAGIRIWGFVKAIRNPAITAYSTASSEAALPKLLEETVRFGVPRRVASFVIPTGYSFNLDGSTLYLVLASLTIAQAAHATDPATYPAMGFAAQIMMVFTFMLTSKGVAGVPRATLVIIAATCGGFGLPADAGIAMLLAVDEIMDMARTTINVIGNGLASVVIAKWEGVFGTDLEPLPDQEPSAEQAG
jgi:Na+/H+-dicarboxylate symporter